MTIGTRSFLPVVVGVLALTALVAGQKGGRRQNTPVATTLHDTGDITLSTNHRLQSDGLGPYSSFVGSKDTVESIIQTESTCCQDWELDLGGSRTRSFVVDLREPLAPNTGAGRPFDWNYVPGRFIVKCHVVFPPGFPGMVVGQVLECPMSMSFPIPGSTSTYWRVNFNVVGDPQTDSVRVECLGVDGAGKCNDWTITPSGLHDGAANNVGRLEKVFFKGHTQPQSFGNYMMSFSVRVTAP
jgi:hypothetical protein